MTQLLMASAAVAGLGLHERVQATAILGIVVLNAAAGWAQEGKATCPVEALCDLEAPAAAVIRSGRKGGGLQQAFLSAVALAVAAVPDGLATEVTVGLIWRSHR
jgi:magnesium-transporting ATPase (P-type)